MKNYLMLKKKCVCYYGNVILIMITSVPTYILLPIHIGMNYIISLRNKFNLFEKKITYK